MSIDFAVISGALDAESCCSEWLRDGKKRGKEWVASNPLRADANPGSFSVNLDTGKWADFAVDGKKGGDLVSLYAYLKCGGDQIRAAKALAEKHGIEINSDTRAAAARKVTDIADSQPKAIIPVPADVQRPALLKHFTHGEPSRVYEYRNAAGRLMMFICRFDPKGMRKQILPYSWCDHPGKAPRWTWRGITGKGKRPLYGLDRLANAPEADAVMVEGEKAADATHAMLDGGAVGVSWMGGVETADRVDVRALAGRRVVLVPDFDSQRQPLSAEDKAAGIDPAAMPLLPLWQQPGVRAMLAIAQQLHGVAREIMMVGYTPEGAGGMFAAGWDLADAQAEGWNGEQVRNLIATCSRDPKAIARGELVPAPSAPDAPPAPKASAQAPGASVPLNEHVNPHGFEHLSDKGQPINSVENLAFLFKEYGIMARYNAVRRNVEVSIPGREYSLDNQSNCALSELTSICARNRMPISNLSEYVKLIADRNGYNPVKDWISSKPWDGKSRIQVLLDTVTTTPEARELKNKLVYRWLLSAVAAVFKPRGFESHGALVFTGAQGVGKTSWVKRLVPDELGVVLVGAVLDPANKDTVTNAVSHWLVELGELDATFRKADVARLKSFITNPVDKLRRPYDRIESEYQRRTVFFASVNETRFLVDDTGNRRWWTVEVIDIEYQHDIDMQQVWAELLVAFEAGEQWHLTPEEFAALNGSNENHVAVDPVEETVRAIFDFGGRGWGTDMTATQVLLAIGYDKPNKAQATHMSGLLRKLTGAEPRKSTGGRRVFPMPPRVGAGLG